MVTFVIFGAAALAILFFFLEVFFKVLSSAFNALLSSGGLVLKIGIIASMTAIALYLLYSAVDGIINNGFWSTLGNIIICAIFIVVAVSLIGGFGSLIISFVVVAVDFILELLDFILEYASYIFEKFYTKFMTIIINRLDKC